MLVTAWGDNIRGHWRNDKVNGEAICKYNSKDMYEGCIEP